MQTQRLFEIIYLLLEKGHMTAADLAKRLEVSTRTIRRDVEKLSGAGVPVYMTRGKGGGVHLMPNYVLSRALLDADQQDEILLALQTLQGTGIAGSTNSNEDISGASTTFNRLASLFQKDDPMDWIEIDFESWGATPSTKEFFSLCREGIMQSKILEFDYFANPLKRKDANTHRKVEPYRLIFRTNSWYLLGYCLLREDWRYFKLSRIRDLQLDSEVFERRVAPKDEGAEEQREIPHVHAHLRFSPDAAFRVLDEFPFDQVSIEEDGHVVIDADVPNAQWIPTYLLSYGGSVEVIEPESWRTVIVQKAAEALTQNQTK